MLYIVSVALVVGTLVTRLTGSMLAAKAATPIVPSTTPLAVTSVAFVEATVENPE